VYAWDVDGEPDNASFMRWLSSLEDIDSQDRYRELAAVQNTLAQAKKGLLQESYKASGSFAAVAREYGFSRQRAYQLLGGPDGTELPPKKKARKKNAKSK